MGNIDAWRPTAFTTATLNASVTLPPLEEAVARIATALAAGGSDPDWLIVSPQTRAELLTLALEGDQWRWRHRRGLRHYARIQERQERQSTPRKHRRHGHGRR